LIACNLLWHCRLNVGRPIADIFGKGTSVPKCVFFKKGSHVNLFEAMRSRSKSNAINSDHLPELNAFVDVAVGGKTDSVPVESIGRTELTVRAPSRVTVGAKALFNYVNGRGSFRFHAECTAIEGQRATFALPAEITVLQKVRDRRRGVRLKHALPVVWRYAPDGIGYGEFTKSFTVDFCSGGLALMVPRELRAGTLVEIKIDLGTTAFTAVGALTRPTVQMASKSFLAGIELRLNLPQANAIDNFIVARQQGQRKRGIADRH
jgi:hypothetical protein